MTTNKFANRLKELRCKNEVTQKELAFFLNYRPTAISNYERGENVPSTKDLIMLAEYFDVSVDYLSGASDLKLPFLGNKYNDFLYALLPMLMELDSDSRKDLFRYIEMLITSQNFKKENNILKVAQPETPYRIKKED